MNNFELVGGLLTKQKNMRLKLILPAAIAIMCSCTKESQKVGVMTDMNGTYKKPLYLNYLNGNYEPNDTATLGSDGVYYFDFKNKQMGYYQLLTQEGKSFSFIFDSTMVLKINSLSASLDKVTYTETKSMSKLQESDVVINRVKQAVEKLNSAHISNTINTLPTAKRDSLIRQIEMVKNEGRLLIDSILKKDNYGFITINVVSKCLDNNLIYNIVTDFDHIFGMTERLNSRYPENASATGFRQKIENIKPIIRKMETLKPGNICIDLKLMATDSSMVQYLPMKKKIFMIHSFNNKLGLEEYFSTVIYPLSAKGYEIIDALTDSLPKTAATKWKNGLIINPPNYFDGMPLPIIIITDENMKIVQNIPKMENLIEVMPQL